MRCSDAKLMFCAMKNANKNWNFGNLCVNWKHPNHVIKCAVGKRAITNYSLCIADRAHHSILRCFHNFLNAWKITKGRMQREWEILLFASCGSYKIYFPLFNNKKKQKNHFNYRPTYRLRQFEIWMVDKVGVWEMVGTNWTSTKDNLRRVFVMSNWCYTCFYVRW